MCCRCLCAVQDAPRLGTLTPLTETEKQRLFAKERARREAAIAAAVAAVPEDQPGPDWDAELDDLLSDDDVEEAPLQPLAAPLRVAASPVADLMYLSFWNELAMADLLAAPPPPPAREPAHTEHAVLLSDRPESP